MDQCIGELPRVEVAAGKFATLKILADYFTEHLEHAGSHLAAFGAAEILRFKAIHTRRRGRFYGLSLWIELRLHHGRRCL